MSTRSALDDTLARAAELGLRAQVEAASFDLDTIEDLNHLAAVRSQPEVSGLCRHTLEYLDAHDLWRHLRGPSRGADVSGR